MFQITDRSEGDEADVTLEYYQDGTTVAFDLTSEEAEVLVEDLTAVI